MAQEESGRRSKRRNQDGGAERRLLFAKATRAAGGARPIECRSDIKFANQIGMDVSSDGPDSFFEKNSDDQTYEDIFEQAFNGKYVVDLIKAVWGRNRRVSYLIVAVQMA